MPDYDYYVNTYLGSFVPEGDFPFQASQARSALEQFERVYKVVGGEEARSMAICAMAEELYDRYRRKDRIAATSVGGVSVRYQAWEETEESMSQALYRKARIYLDFYRKVR